MKQVLVVLGHKTDALRRTRARAAVRYLEEHPYEVALTIFSGWQGEAEEMCRLAFPEGRASAPCAVRHETQSRHTLENAAYTAELLSARGYDPAEKEIVVVTNPFHAFRAYLTFRRFFPTVRMVAAREGIPADQPNLVAEELAKVARYNFAGDIFPGCFIRDLVAQVVSIVP